MQAIEEANAILGVEEEMEETEEGAEEIENEEAETEDEPKMEVVSIFILLLSSQCNIYC